jgi:uncharacterized membrane protein
MLYLFFKWLHVLAAITALGSNITYGFWMNRAARTPQALVYILQTIKAIDSQLANRAYGALLITGVIMFYLGRWPLTTSWLITAILLYVIVGALGFFFFAPALRKQISVGETSGPQSEEYQAIARRSNLFGVITVVLVVIIVFLMVTKPRFWG